MDLKYLQTFKTIIEEGGFTKGGGKTQLHPIDDYLPSRTVRTGIVGQTL